MFCGITTETARKIFPSALPENLDKYLPQVASAADSSRADRTLFVLALATIRAETEVFVPLCEQPLRWNTSHNGKRFDLYDHRRDLGNQGPPDGERFRGRGYVQLTGRANYARLGPAVKLDLIASPDDAALAEPAAAILFQFLNEKQDELRRFAKSGDLGSARRLVNGGTHGLKPFTQAFAIANSLLPIP